MTNNNTQSKDPQDNRQAMQPIALGSEVVGNKPQGFFVNDEPVVLFRDANGAVRALEDRCCHRRIPLSLGKVRQEGWLQCGYHGWSFDGETGQCKAIPNLADETQVPRTYGVYAYHAIEKNGLVYVSVPGDETNRITDSWMNSMQCGSSGRLMVGLAQADYVAALMDNPMALISFAGVKIANTIIQDPQEENGCWVMERAASWLGQTSFGAFVREYALIFRLEIQALTGESWLSIQTASGKVVAAAHLTATSSRRGVTAILWQSYTGDASGFRPALLRSFTSLGVASISPRKQINMAAVVATVTGPSDLLPQQQQNKALYGDMLIERGSKQWL